LIRKSGSIEVKGIVLAVLDHSVDVVLIYLGIIRRLYVEVSCECYKVKRMFKNFFSIHCLNRNYH
jgi:hypothetical protein